MRGYVGIIQTDQTCDLKVTLLADEVREGGRDDVFDHVQNSATDETSGNNSYNCIMTTIGDPLDGLNSDSLFAVCIFWPSMIFPTDTSPVTGLRTGRK